MEQSRLFPGVGGEVALRYTPFIGFSHAFSLSCLEALSPTSKIHSSGKGRLLPLDSGWQYKADKSRFCLGPLKGSSFNL